MFDIKKPGAKDILRNKQNSFLNKIKFFLSKNPDKKALISAAIEYNLDIPLTVDFKELEKLISLYIAKSPNFTPADQKILQFAAENFIAVTKDHLDNILTLCDDIDLICTDISKYQLN